MNLQQLLLGLPYTILQGEISAVDIQGLRYDSRKVHSGDLFVCVSGFMTDGHQFAEQACQAGAVAVLTERPLDLPGAVLIQVENCRKMMPALAARFFSEPSKKLKLVGVTGTNGKTSVTHFIKAILEAHQRKTGLLGTLYAQIDEETVPAHNTTPEAIELEDFLVRCQQKKAEYAVMEVSSHALDLHRVSGLHFHSAIFTNLTQDHLDYHHTMENYLQAKAKLFQMLPAEGFAVINADDPAAAYLLENCSAPVITYGFSKLADVQALAINNNAQGTDCQIRIKGDEFPLHLQLLGEFNLYNALAAMAWGVREGIPIPVIFSALSTLQGVAGRFEPVKAGQDFAVIVDYAHTPDGLQNVLQAARKLTARQLVTVFGCGGDRDRSKRPLMGEIAEELSDLVIVTSDNPRSEDPEAIIADILSGISCTDKIQVVPDRYSAIKAALECAQNGDVVLIAGKGHENYQILKDRTINFDDRLIVKQLLEPGKCL